MMQDSPACGQLSDFLMNRIREIRERAGLSSDDLAERVGTSGAQIRRLELGDRKLTADWMQKIAEALGCTPADLISNATIAEARNEVEVAEDSQFSAVAVAIGSRGMRIYRVTEQGKSVVRAGIGPGDIITVDETEARIAAVKSLDIVLVQLEDDKTVLRQFVHPDLLITNRHGANIAISTDDPAVNPVIVGVVVKE